MTPFQQIIIGELLIIAVLAGLALWRVWDVRRINRPREYDDFPFSRHDKEGW